jgi:hypothetical protein
MVYSCHSSYSGSENKNTEVYMGLGINEPHPKNNERKKRCGRCWSDKAPA